MSRATSRIAAAVCLAFSLSSGGIGAAAAAKGVLKPIDAESKMAPSFSLEDLSGENRNLSEFSGKVLLVNFWATWCTPCIKELPSMEAIRETLKSEPFDVIAINVGEDKIQIEEFLRKRLGGPLALEVLMDGNMIAAKAWKVRAVPTTYIVDHAGQLVYIATGEMDFAHEDVVSQIRALISAIPG